MLLYSFTAFSENKVTDENNSNRVIEITLFPVNVVPNIVSNTFIYLFNPIVSLMIGKSSNLWPIISFISPVLGPIAGVVDAWYGYPFWAPVALDEHRKYK